jgi:endonuclease-3
MNMADEKAKEILALLKTEYPEIKIALHYSNPLELLIATILSAQCTDKQVNQVTRKLFLKYRTPQDFIEISQEELEKEIYSTGFYRSKSKNILGACKIIVNEFNSQVPDTMEELIKLPGVGRKTANIVLSGAFGKIEGMAVDTHVKRLSGRLGLTAHTDPEKIEKDLLKIIPKNDWDIFSLLLINHGRKVCPARKPLCEVCILNKLCTNAFAFK